MAKQISILIVDDEESVRDSLLNWFIEDGYHVVCAENAKKALLLLESEYFDIILADIKMPGMSGVELLKWVREYNRSLPVLMTTGFPTLDTAIEALALSSLDMLDAQLFQARAAITDAKREDGEFTRRAAGLDRSIYKRTSAADSRSAAPVAPPTRSELDLLQTNPAQDSLL